VIFALKGALVGKMLATSLFLPGYVILTDASQVETVVIVVVTAVGYVGSRRYGRSYVARLPFGAPVLESASYDAFDRWFRHYGRATAFLSNFVPWVRGVFAVPAGTSAYPLGRYTFYTTSTTR